MNDASIITLRCASCMKPVGALDCPISERDIGQVLIDKKINPLCVTCATIIMTESPLANLRKGLKVLAYLEKMKREEYKK